MPGGHKGRILLIRSGASRRVRVFLGLVVAQIVTCVAHASAVSGIRSTYRAGFGSRTFLAAA